MVSVQEVAAPKGRTEHRYASLDGLRGVAAVVVLGHHVEAVWKGPGVLSHGYLAVDFFFVLSGFVVALAYEGRLATGMSFGDFARLRFIRLYPMIFAGALLGGLGALIIGWPDPLTLALVSQLLLIPGLAGGGALFLLNSPHWSLLFEIFANLAHAALYRWASTGLVAAGVAVSAVALVFTGLIVGHLGVGWSPGNWWGGFPRVAFSYGAGVLIWRLYRMERLPTVKLPFPLLAACLVAFIVLTAMVASPYGDILFVLVISPLLLIGSIHATSRLSVRPMVWLGLVSYPLYAIHEPIVALWGRYLPHSWLSGLAVAVVCLGLAYLADRFYDTQARTWLKAALVRTHRA